MKIDIEQGKKTITLPTSVANICGAGKNDYKVLIALAANPELCGNYPEGSKKAAEAIGISQQEFDMAVGFWRGAGVISLSDGTSEDNSSINSTTDDTQNIGKTINKPEAKAVEPEEAFPKYTTEELNEILERRHEAKVLIDECQKIIGKMFSPFEVNIVLGMLDYLKLDSEYILTLTAFCVKIGKKSIRYIEKYAITLYDKSIDSNEKLNEYIKREEASAEIEIKIRTILGIGERALTSKEKKYFTTWAYDYKFSMEMITSAYEKTVNSGKTRIVDYMNGILEAWHANGIDTVEKVQAADAEKANNSDSFGKGKGSFDTDEFFEAAVKRGMDINNF